MTKQEMIAHPYILDEGYIVGVGEARAIIKLGDEVLGYEETMKLRKKYKGTCFSHIKLAVGEKLLPQGFDGAVVRFGNYQYDFKFNKIV